MSITRKVGQGCNTSKLLLEIALGFLGDATNPMLGTKGIYIAAKKLNMGEYQAKSALQSLERNGYVKREGRALLITPKGRRRVGGTKTVSKQDGWDRKWRIVIYDIPEKDRSARDALRYYLRDNGFVKLQNSVFISPTADFDELDSIRREYKVEKYVNFFEAKSVAWDDDSRLRKIFSLKK